jgi:hypothetical protein
MMTDTLKNPNPLPIVEPPTPTAPSEHSTDPEEKRFGLFSKILLAVIFIALVLGGLGIWWSFQPPKFDVLENARALTGSDAEQQPVAGAVTVATAIKVADTLLNKPGGYLQNDVMPPGVLMDNITSWEYGVLTELRDSVRSLRNDFSRSQSQSIENPFLKDADSEFNFDSDAWFLPSAEEEYRDGVVALQGFLDSLVSANDQSARFSVRADNLSAYLAVVEKRLGSYGQRLTASVGDPELTAALTPSGPDLQPIEGTPWSEIDNTFFEARGYTWALLHMMKALTVDFQKVLADKNAQVSMQQIIRDLEKASTRKWNPFVLNGHGFGWVANHSLVLASYMARANAAVLDLRQLLLSG